MVRCWTAGTAWDNSHRQTSSATQHEYPQQREESFFPIRARSYLKICFFTTKNAAPAKNMTIPAPHMMTIKGLSPADDLKQMSFSSTKLMMQLL